MKYRFRFKGTNVAEEEKRTRSDIGKKKKMLLLLIWSVIAIGLYLFFSKLFAMTPAIVCEVMLFLGLFGYLINILLIRRAVKKESDNTKKIVKLENIGMYLLIFVLPLVFIILFDFMISSFKMFGK